MAETLLDHSIIMDLQSLWTDYQLDNNKVLKAEVLNFINLPPGHTVYNITPPFFDGTAEILFGRVEPETSETAETWAFRNNGGLWKPTGCCIPNLQDPFYTFIDHEFVFGGVRLTQNPDNRTNGQIYYTVFWRVRNWQDTNKIPPFSSGPLGQKDIRLIELNNKKIGVFTRPQGEIGGKGVISYTEIDNLDQLNPETISSAAAISDLNRLFNKETVWGGVNQLVTLPSRKIGVLGHLAYYNNEPVNNSDIEISRHIVLEGRLKNYYPLSFIFDPHTRKVTDVKILFTRSCLPKSQTKILRGFHPLHLKKVIFTGDPKAVEDGNVMTGKKMTYLMNEDRFLVDDSKVFLPKGEKQ